MKEKRKQVPANKPVLYLTYVNNFSRQVNYMDFRVKGPRFDKTEWRHKCR